MDRQVGRRSFLCTTAATLGAAALAGCKATGKPDSRPLSPVAASEPSHGLGAEEVDSPIAGRETEFVRVLLHEADGSVLADDRAKLLYARDLANDPLPVAIARAAGRARVGIPDEPIQVVCRLKIPRFGEVYCYADNGGRGYRRAETIEFVVDAAATRLRRVREAAQWARRLGVSADAKLEEHLAQAGRPIPVEQGTPRIAAAYESLSHGMHAGERIALNLARHRIARLAAPRKDFLFGAACAGFDVRGPAFQKQFVDAFNFATGLWYTWRPENAQPPVDYARMDAGTDWCLKQGIPLKIFGYLYMARGATPEWSRPFDASVTQPATRPQFNERWNYARLRQLYPAVIEATTRRYDGRVKYVEVMNEAHDKANLWRLSHQQVLEMARDAFAAARRGSATMKRQMNHCCLWAEYAKDRNSDGSRRWSPYQFVKTCFDHGIDYEVIGLQLYYPQFDLFEIDRMLDRFKVFNRPLHITEIATASQDGLDPESMRPKTYAPGWHGPWNEAMQADWVEGIYTLVYSKPEFEAIGWWDFCDAPGHFWPFGGMLHKDMTPKEAYFRLLKLQRQWGVAKSEKGRT